jgi:DNA polymerase
VSLRQIVIEESFDSFRDAARRLIAHAVTPDDIVISSDEAQAGLFEHHVLPVNTDACVFTAPREFVEQAKIASLHRDESRWNLLYRLLWRLTHGEEHLLHDHADDDVIALMRMAKAVKRDAHKMEAFVRFRRIEDEQGELYIAFHRPEHRVLPLVADFFVERFNPMRWSILTPDGSVHWDRKVLRFDVGADRSPVNEDDLEELWRSYYASIFNPARINVNAMKREMAVRHWRTLPEAELIPGLIAQAPGRVRDMVEVQRAAARSAADYMPAVRSLPVLREAVQLCRGCDIGACATQPVFGEGPANARVMLVGEQPGDQEDVQGKPFVGPAGEILDRVLREAGLPREGLYITNAVKHFKFVTRGKRRLHSRPSAREMKACRPWLDAEIEIVQPKLLVLLGATAAQSLLGAGFRLTHNRSVPFASRWSPWTFATLHPSALLRMPAQQAEIEWPRYVNDFRVIAARVGTRC